MGYGWYESERAAAAPAPQFSGQRVDLDPPAYCNMCSSHSAQNEIYIVAIASTMYFAHLILLSLNSCPPILSIAVRVKLDQK